MKFFIKDDFKEMVVTAERAAELANRKLEDFPINILDDVLRGYRSHKKTVWQWRYKNNEQTHWKVAKSLLTEREAKEYYIGCDIEKHAGPFEVAP